MPSSSPSSSPLVLVTGVSGFLATHVIDSLLASTSQYRIRGTLRSLSKKDSILARLSSEDAKRLEFVEVKSLESSSLTEAVHGVDGIVHCASPFQVNVKDVEKDLLIPAVEGTLNLLRHAAKESSVKKIAITSSLAAVLDPLQGAALRPGYKYSEKDWNPVTWDQAVKYGGGGSLAYTASKGLAEKAAWDFMKTEKPQFEIATVNPPMIYGPALQSGANLKHLNTSSAQIYALISSLPSLPPDGMPQFCHVRDVADAHVKWLSSSPSAPSKRYLVCGGTFSWKMAAEYISKSRPELQSRLPKGWEQETTDEEEIKKKASTLDCTPAIQELKMTFKPWKETFDATLDTLLALEQSHSTL